MRSRGPASSWSWSVLLTVVSLLVTASAFGLANFGGPLWVFVLLFAWMLTIGLPTFVAVVVTAFLWSGVSLEAFVATASAAAFVVQLSALRVVPRMFRGQRA